MPSRVCFVSLRMYSYFKPEATETMGGAERQLYLLSQALLNRFEIHAAVGDYGQPKREVRDGVILHRTYNPDQTFPSLTRLIEFIKLIKLGLAMKRADADVYVYRGHPRKAGIVALIARLLRKEFIYNLANDPNVTDQRDDLSVPFRLLFDCGIRNAETIITQTSKQQQLVREHIGVESTVVPNGYPIADETFPHNKRGPAIWVGRFDRDQKRPHLFLDVAEQLPGYEFLLIGPAGLDEEYYERVTGRANDLNNVTYIGQVDPNEIHAYYRRASVLVNTSAFEGFPNTFLEAWRYATPVASLDIDPSRYLNISMDGYAEENLVRLRNLVERFLSETEKRRRVGNKSKSEFKSKYALKSVAEEYVNAITKP